MDKFKETIMINTLTNDPMSVTFENIDIFFNDVICYEFKHYIEIFINILKENSIQNNYINVLSDYINNKLLNIVDL